MAERSGRRRPLPLMEQCRGCHRERDAPLSCRSCHPVGPDGLLRTRFAQLAPEYGPLPTGDPARRPEPATPSPGLLRPSGSRLGIGHDLRWSRTHGRVAGGEAQLCQSCHAGEWCRRCHAGRFLPLRIHPAGWQGEHAVASRSGELRCASCHRHSSFCRTCHQRLGVVPPAEGTPHPLAPAARFHPPAWATVSAPGAGHHGEQARRSLPTCVSCHAEETCIRCHRTRELQGLGVSPHSPGIAGRCRSLLRANPRGCVLCHGQALAQDPRCR
ncbi:MAG: hypothetical protein FJ125_00060 [Deltaproteobacteria bacterium]|nr:hypothetical protein [Deltaproteobacteria bacterium]